MYLYLSQLYSYRSVTAEKSTSILKKLTLFIQILFIYEIFGDIQKQMLEMHSIQV